ncbi:50S ribosomal protein P1 [Candidatus Pacearchaeota archaeon]|nr:50S ribosomal protein P1 [Candidatus Pacearchaeota archaeon]
MEYVYAALLLHKVGKPVNEEHLHKVIQATGATVNESKIKSIVASLHGVDIDAEIANAVIASAAPASGGASAKPAEEKKEEKKAEESAAGLSSLFG